jgi:hypothetical protein
MGLNSGPRNDIHSETFSRHVQGEHDPVLHLVPWDDFELEESEQDRSSDFHLQECKVLAEAHAWSSL